MKIKVMSFNLRVPSDADGINHFKNRESNVLKAIDAENPDIIGFQEATDYSRAFLRRKLSDRYAVIGAGRMADYRGESCCIAIRLDSFELVNFETRFLSNTPAVPQSTYVGSDQSHCPRLYVHAELSCGEGKMLHFYNTHLDHKGETARLLGMTQIMQSVSECNAPFVLTGDMNALPDSPEIKLPALLPNKNVREATESIPHTFHGFGRIEENYKIDYIFTDAPFSDTHAVEDKCENGIYISDHYPVCTTVEL